MGPEPRWILPASEMRRILIVWTAGLRPACGRDEWLLMVRLSVIAALVVALYSVRRLLRLGVMERSESQSNQ